VRLGDNAFELTDRLGALLTDFHLAAANTAGVTDLIRELVHERSLHVEFCRFVATGKFIIVERFYKSLEREILRSLVWDSAALAALLAKTEPQRGTHLETYYKKPLEFERDITASGNRQKTLRNYAKTSVIWSTGILAASVTWIGASGTIGAITIISKSSTKKAADALENLALSLVIMPAHSVRLEDSGF